MFYYQYLPVYFFGFTQYNSIHETINLAGTNEKGRDIARAVQAHWDQQECIGQLRK